MPASPLAYEVIINIIYKRTPDFKFNTEYLVQKHIPAVAKAWTPHGLLGATVSEPAADSDYAMMVAVRFRTMDGWVKASGDAEQMGPLLADVANFANQTPEFVVGRVVEGGIFETS